MGKCQLTEWREGELGVPQDQQKGGSTQLGCPACFSYRAWWRGRAEPFSLPASRLPWPKEDGNCLVGGGWCMCRSWVWGTERREGPLPATLYTCKNDSEPDPLQATADTQKEKRRQRLKGGFSSVKQQKNQTCTGCSGHTWCPQHPSGLTSP